MSSIGVRYITVISFAPSPTSVATQGLTRPASQSVSRPVLLVYQRFGSFGWCRRDKVEQSDPDHQHNLHTHATGDEPESLATATHTPFPSSVLPAYLRHLTQFKDTVIVPSQFLSSRCLNSAPLLSGLVRASSFLSVWQSVHRPIEHQHRS
jgi:hypothetical protein